MNKTIATTLCGIAVAALFMLPACKHQSNLPIPATAKNDTTKSNNPNTPDTSLCFERDVLPIFISNCAKAGCHDAVTQEKGYRFTDYNSIVSKDFVPGNAGKTELYEKITETRADKIMPPPPNAPLNNTQISLIYRWIQEGAKSTTGCQTLCDTTKFTFGADIQPMLNKYCAGCHSGATAPKGITLNSYTGMVSAVNGNRLLGAIKQQSGFTAMPQGGSKLSDCEIRIIEKWIGAGMPNN